jgi:hypothetical protein
VSEGEGDHDEREADHGDMVMPDDATLVAYINDPVVAVRGLRFAVQEPPKAPRNVFTITGRAL